MSFKVPTRLSIRTTLGAYETQEVSVQIPSDFDFLLQEIVMQTDVPLDSSLISLSKSKSTVLSQCGEASLRLPTTLRW